MSINTCIANFATQNLFFKFPSLPILDPEIIYKKDQYFFLTTGLLIKICTSKTQMKCDSGSLVQAIN